MAAALRLESDDGVGGRISAGRSWHRDPPGLMLLVSVVRSHAFGERLVFLQADGRYLCGCGVDDE